MKPEIIIIEQKDKKIIFEDTNEFLKLLDKFYEAGYQDGRKSNLTITTPSESNSPWITKPYHNDDSSGAIKDWSQKIVYTTNNNVSTIANNDTKID